MLFNLWIFKQIVLYPCNGRLHNNKKEEIINTHNSMENHRCWVIREKSYSHKAMYYVILSIWHFEKGKIVETKKISNSQELCVGGEWYLITRGHKGIFGGDGQFHVLIVVVVIQI